MVETETETRLNTPGCLRLLLCSALVTITSIEDYIKTVNDTFPLLDTGGFTQPGRGLRRA